MPPVVFEPTIPASARPQTYALDRAATGIGRLISYRRVFGYRFMDGRRLKFIICDEFRNVLRRSAPYAVSNTALMFLHSD
jgi:hypothetical protein